MRQRDKEREDPWGKRDPLSGRALWERKCVSHILQSESFFEPLDVTNRNIGEGQRSRDRKEKAGFWSG